MFAQFGLTVTAAALLAGTAVGSPVSSTAAPAPEMGAQMSTIMADVQLSAVQLPTYDTSVLLVDGTDLKSFNPSPVGISFNGLFLSYEHIEEILYPRNLSSSSERIGTENLLLALDRTTGKVMVVGFSQGANVNKGAREKLVKDGDLSRVNELTFFDYGSPGFMAGPDSPFTTIKVAYEYDGIAVWPANPFNLLAYANAMQGALKVHPQMYENADINELAKWVKYEGNTTYVVLHNDNLPIISNFAYAIGLGELIEKIIRPGIDRAYRWEKLGFVKVTGPVIDVTAPVGEARFVQESAPSLIMGVNQDFRESDEPMQGEVNDPSQQPEAEVSPLVAEQSRQVEVDVQPVNEPVVVDETSADTLPLEDPKVDLDEDGLSDLKESVESDDIQSPGKQADVDTESQDKESTVKTEQDDEPKKETAKDSDSGDKASSSESRQKRAKKDRSESPRSTSQSDSSDD